MNKRYIDFVQKRPAADAAKASTPVLKPVEKPVQHFKPDFGPVKRTIKKPVAKPAAVPVRPLARPVEKPVEKPVQKPVEKPTRKNPVNDSFKELTKPLTNSSIKTNEALFEDEDVFGIIEDYHPIHTPSQITKRPLSAAPAQPATPARPVSRPVPLGGKSPFIRTTATVEKRPLSNSVSQRKPATPATPAVEEKPSAPVTIIEKPEKDAHIGIIVTVILTIVFGAAIGTVAFLLLPK